MRQKNSKNRILLRVLFSSSFHCLFSPVCSRTQGCPIFLCLPFLLTDSPRFPAVSYLCFSGRAYVRNWKMFKRALSPLLQTQPEQLCAQSLSSLEFLVIFHLGADQQGVNKDLHRISLILNSFLQLQYALTDEGAHRVDYGCAECLPDGTRIFVYVSLANILCETEP